MVAMRAANDTLANPAELHFSPEQMHVSVEIPSRDTLLHPVESPAVPHDLATASTATKMEK